MKKLFALLFVAAFAVAANAQDLNYLMAGPRAEYMFRRAYAPVDFAIGQAGQYAGYGQHGRTAAIAAGATTGMAVGAAIGAGMGHSTRDALIGAGAGAAAGGLLTYAVTRPRGGSNQTYTSITPDGRQVLVASGSQKSLDCGKPRGKRGKNEAACAATEAEAIARQQAMEAAARQEAEQRALAASPWRLYNRTGFTIDVFDGDKYLGQMRVNQSWRVLGPTSGFRAVILAPDFSGSITEHEARVRPASDFQGWVITSPRVEEE